MNASGRGHRIGKQPLTLEKWDQYIQTLSTDLDIDPDTSYSEIYSSPVLRDYFLALPESKQDMILEEVNLDQRGVELGALVGLLIRLENSRTTITSNLGDDFSDWIGSSPAMIVRAVYSMTRSEWSADFVVQTEMFTRHQTSFRSYHETVSQHYEMTVYLLRVIYDEERVATAIKMWNKSATQPYLIQDFINLVDNWDQFDKFSEMPFEWALNVMQEERHAD